MPVHLRPSAPTAPDAILCGDPGRALAIAQRVLDRPRMSNHHHGLWGYHGLTPTGAELTVQATGIGGPSAVVVISELAQLGLRRAIRVGTCAALGPAPAVGSGLIAGRAIACDGASVALGAEPGAPLEPDRGLLDELRASALPVATVFSRDVAASPPPGGGEGGAVVDLQTAATFAFGRREGIAVAAVLAVASSTGRRLEDEPLESTLLRLAAVAVRALLPEAGTNAKAGP